MTSLSAQRQLLERERERSRISELLAATSSGGDGHALLIEGPAGIGKTELLGVLRHEAENRGAQVLTARASEPERDYTFGVIRQLFEPALRSAVGREVLLAGAANRVKPLLTGAWVDERPTPDLSFQIFHGLYWLTVNLAEKGPLVVCVDDAHWADPVSVDFLGYLMRRLERLPVLIALAERSGTSVSAPHPLSHIREERLCERLDLSPLTPEAVRELLRRAVPGAGDDVGRAFHEVSQGNPFLVAELIRELVGTNRQRGVTAEQVRELVPQAVSETVLVRLSRLGDAARQLACAVAALGGGVHPPIATAVSGLTADATAAAADELVGAEILDPGHPLRFIHPLVRSSIYADIPHAQRTELHRRAAEALSDIGAPAERVAIHLVETAPSGDPRTVAALLRAGSATLAGGRTGVAAKFLRRALEEPAIGADRRAVLTELLKADALRGDLSSLNRFEQLAQQGDLESQLLVSFAPLAIRGMFATGNDVQAVRLVETIASDSDAETALRLEAELIATAIRFPSTAHTARERLAQHAAVTHPQTSAARLMAANLAFDRAMRGDDAVETASLALRALAGGQLLADEGSDSQPFYAAVEALTIAGRPHEAEQALRPALDDARRRGSLIALAYVTAEQCLAAFARGDLAEAAEGAHTTLRVAREGGWAHAVRNFSGLLVEVLVEQDQLDAAADELAAAEVPERLSIEERGAARLFAGRGHLRLARGEAILGGLDLLCASRAAARAGYEFDYECTASLAATVLRSTSDQESATERADQDLLRARAFGSPRSLGIALRAKALAGGGDGALGLLEQSLEQLSASDARLEHARTLVELGAVLRKRRRRKAARGALREGIALADACGAIRLGRRAREELAACGERVPARTLTGAEALTPSERRIATMAADGLSNKAIAQALFLTLKTVEFHLSNTYKKLNLGSRAQLREALVAPAARSERTPRP